MGSQVKRLIGGAGDNRMFLPTGRIQHKSQRCGPEFIVPAYLLAYFEAFYDKRYRMLANHSIVYVRGQAPQPTEELANIYHGIGRLCTITDNTRCLRIYGALFIGLRFWFAIKGV